MSRATQDTTKIDNKFVYAAIMLYGVTFQKLPLLIISSTAWSYNPDNAVTKSVWANPRSLATTSGIIIIFFSYGY